MKLATAVSLGASVFGLGSDAATQQSIDPSEITEDLAYSTLRQMGSCCRTLSFLFWDKVSFQEDAAYEASLDSYWSLREANLEPACVFRPESTLDVSAAVFVLSTGDYIFPGQCKFAVRSGGHTPWAGSANIEGGVTFDLQHLDHVNISLADKTVKIGPGNRWNDVYSALVPEGLATSGGRVGTVGVGGLVTGGGLSFFTPRFGYVCDNVVSFQVVLAGGRIVNANAHENDDLWVALRGGSNNFGIVTEFTMKTFEQGDFWGGFIGLDNSTRDQQYEAFEAFTAAEPYDPYAALIFNQVYRPSTGWAFSHNVEYTKPEVNPPAFRPFTSLPQTFNTMRISNLSDIAADAGGDNPPGFRQEFTTATYRNSAAFLKRFSEIAIEDLAPVADIPSLLFAVIFQPLPTVIQAVAETEGGSSLGLDESDGNLMNVNVNVHWQEKEDDELILGQLRKIFDRANREAREMGVDHPFLYLNYAAEWQDPISGYGPEVETRLKATSKRYDPRGIFQRQVPGGFKLWR